jgi:hypothetical protein
MRVSRLVEDEIGCPAREGLEVLTSKLDSVDPTSNERMAIFKFESIKLSTLS